MAAAEVRQTGAGRKRTVYPPFGYCRPQPEARVSPSGGRFDGLPADWTDLLSELDQQPHDLTVPKRTWGALTHTDLAEWLKAIEVTQVVVCGVTTGIGVESTARQAHELGFHVTPAADAMLSASKRFLGGWGRSLRRRTSPPSLIRHTLKTIRNMPGDSRTERPQ